MSPPQLSALARPSLAPVLQSMKAAMAQEAALLAGKLAQLQRQRDDAFADAAFAREEARVAAASSERALAAATAAQRQLQTERDAVMQSLTELQAAFNVAEAKRAAEMQRLRQVAEERQQEADRLRSRLSRRQAAGLRASGECHQGAAAAAIAAATMLAPMAAQGSRAAAVRRRDADMEGDLVLQRSVDSGRSGASSAGAPAEPLPLQPAHGNAAASPPHGQHARRQPKQQGAAATAEDGGWGSNYAQRFQVGGTVFGMSCSAPLRHVHCVAACQPLAVCLWPARQPPVPPALAVQENVWSPGVAAKARPSSTAGGGGAPQRGLLAALSGHQRVVVSQDENSLGAGGGAKRLGRFQVDRYERLAEGSGS